jgi:hypothetical protein
VLGHLFRTRLPNFPGCCFRCLAGHTVHTQHGVTTSAGRRRGTPKLPARPGWQPELGL